jgi:hypothetical protein
MSTLVSPDLLWLAQGLLVALTAGLALALVVSVLLLARPGVLFALNARMSRWIDTRRQFDALETPHQLERFFYRHHRAVGAAIIGGTGYVLWQWAFAYEREAFLLLLDRRWVTGHLDWVPVALETALVGLHGAILLIGVVILLRPSLLKGLERAANRWHQLPREHRLDRVVAHLDTGFELYPRLSGLILLLATAWSLASLIPVLGATLGR